MPWHAFDPAVRNELLARFPPADLALVEAELTPVSFPRGLVLYEAGDRMEQIYFPSDGVISLVAEMENGARAESATIGREGAIGLLTDGEPGLAFSQCIVQVPGYGHRLEARRFTQLAGGKAMRDLIRRYADVLLAQTLQSVACNALHTVEARFCRWLLMCDDRTDADFVALTQEFLAEMLGVQRTTVTLVARTLQGSGLIRYHRGRIKVVDRPGLEEAACECYGIVRRHRERLMPRLIDTAPNGVPTLAATL